MGAAEVRHPVGCGRAGEAQDGTHGAAGSGGGEGAAWAGPRRWGHSLAWEPPVLSILAAGAWGEGGVQRGEAGDPVQ